MNLSDKQKGVGLSLFGVLIITPDSLFIRLINIPSWELLFYRGLIPSIFLLLGLIIYYKKNFFKSFLVNGIAGLFFAVIMALGNTTFVISIQNTNVANTLVMVALAPMLSAIFGAIFLKEKPDRNTLIAIVITFLSVLYIFYDSVKLGNIYGDILGFITSAGLAAGATIIRAGKSLNLVPSAVVGKLVVALVALFFIDSFELKNNDIYIIPAMCILCVAIPFVLVTLAPRYITGAEVNLFFLMETVLGPIWVWMVVKEQPSIETIQGGIIIILTIAIHSFLAIKKTQTKTT